MSRNGKLTVLITTLLFTAPILAKAPASAPAGSTGLCQDGSYSLASAKSGACSGHGGVKKWYGAAAETSAAAEPAPAKSKAEKPAKPEKAVKAEKPEPRASAPAAESAAATGMCKDGTTTTAGSKSGACSGHGGVKDWYVGAAATTAPVASPAAASRAAPASAPAPAPAPKAASGGGNGQVWVNTDSKVYHCQGDQWYGKTKSGSYMSESGAIAQGYHADHGKACH